MKISTKINHNFIGYIPPETEPRFPGKDDDETKGYSVDSRWYHPETENIFICVDPTTGDAKWSLIEADSRIVNNTAGVLSAFRFVRAVGDQGGHTEVVYANASTDDDYYGITGITFEDVSIGDFSFQGHSGAVVRNVPLPTGTWTAGDTGYLQDTDGQWGPIPGTHRVRVFTVHKAHATQGIIFIDIQRGIELKEADDVAYVDPTLNGQFLGHNTADGEYKPTRIKSTDGHLITGYTGGADPSVDLTVINTICHFPIGIEFGSTTQEYAISGTTWISAVSGGALGGIPDETESGHKLADCLAAISVAREGDYLSVREKAGAPSATNPLTIHALFEDITKFDTLDLRLDYLGGSAHTMAYEFWNYTTSTWSRLGEFSATADYLEFSQKVFGSSNFIGTGADAGKVKLQIIHDSTGNTAHYIKFDVVSICDGGGGGGAATQNVYPTFTGDTGSSTASGPDDSMAVVGDQGIETTVTDDQVSIAVTNAVLAGTKGDFNFPLYQGGGVLTVGEYAHLEISTPYEIEIISWEVLCDQTGSIVVDLWADNYANYPPTVADTITGSTPPTVTDGIKNESSTLIGWDTTHSAKTKIRPKIISNLAITDAKVIVYFNKTGV